MTRRDGILSGLRLPEEKYRELMDALDRNGGPPPFNNRSLRATRRMHDLQVALTQPGGTRIEFLVVTRNISAQGLAFIHGHYVHVGTRFEAQLPSVDGGAIITIKGQVVRCRHVSGLVHEVAVKFDKTIDLPSFAKLSPEEEEQFWQLTCAESEEEQAGDERQRHCLVIDSAKSQRAIAGIWLSRMGFEVTEAGSAADALTILKSGVVDLILLEVMLEQDDGMDLCKRIREVGHCGSIIVVTAETDSAIHRQATEAGADLVVTKPITGRGLHEAIENLSRRNEGEQADHGPVHSSLASDESMAILISEYVASLPVQIDKLLSACDASDLDRLNASCKTLRAEGGAHGFWQITRSAEAVIDALGAQADIANVNRSARQLISILRRATDARAPD